VFIKILKIWLTTKKVSGEIHKIKYLAIYVSLDSKADLWTTLKMMGLFLSVVNKLIKDGWNIMKY